MSDDQARLSRLASWIITRMGRQRLSKTSGSMRLPGLQGRVEVIRDRWGVPHIYAGNETDLLFAQGFVHAQDRFWQMEFQRRLVAGRLAELIGAAAVEVDRWMRVLGMYQAAEREASQFDALDQAGVDAYTRGVNAWIRRGRLPLEFSLLQTRPELWSPADSVAWSKMMAWTLSGNWEVELMRQQLVETLGPERAAQLDVQAEDSWPVILALPEILRLEKSLAQAARSWSGPGPAEGVGSNNWVISGERTASGKPILANDMHLLLCEPSIWYENHLSGGDLQVTGVSLPGLPLVIAGHNGQVAWGFTAGFADVQDLYEEHLRKAPADTARKNGHGPASRVEYEYQGQWYPAEVRREEIRVRFGKPVIEKVIVTRHGPIISPLVGQETRVPLALRWTASETSGGTFRALQKMNRARTCQEFREALRTWSVPVLNVVYADTDGNIAYMLAGKIPLRAPDAGWIPVPGWTSDHEWKGVIPFESLPHLVNPPSGFIATANNRTAGPDYPYYLGRDYIASDRAERIVELILARPHIDLDYVARMQMDLVSPSARQMAGLVGQLQFEDARLERVAGLFRGWDGALLAGSPAAAVYEVLVRQLLRMILEQHLGERAARFSGAALNEISGGNQWAQQSWEWLRRQLERPESPWFDVGGGETREQLLRKAVRRAADILEAEQGSDVERWAWGKFHRLTFRHILDRMRIAARVFNRGPYPLGGDGNTIWASGCLVDRIDSSDGVVGPSFRFIADLSDLGRSLSVLAPGQSGQVGSPHYDDQLEDWFSGRYHPVLFNREDVSREQEALLELLP